MGQPEPLSGQDDAIEADGTANGGSMEEILASIRKIIASENASEPVDHKPDIEDDKYTSGTGVAHSAKMETGAHRPEPASPSEQIEARAPTQSASVSTAENMPETSPRPTLSSLAASLKNEGRQEKPQETSASPNARSTDAGESLSTRPVAQTPSSTPGGLAALAERIKREMPISEKPVPSQPGSTSPTQNSEDRSAQKAIPMPADEPVQAEAVRKPVSLGDIAAMATRNSENLQSVTTKPEPEQTDPEKATSGVSVAASAENAQDNKAAAGMQTHQDTDPVAAEFREALVSPSTKSAVSGSMERLKKAATEVETAQVEAVLRPLLKQWLDENLPALVEKLVSEEISRIAKQDVA